MATDTIITILMDHRLTKIAKKVKRGLSLQNALYGWPLYFMLLQFCSGYALCTSIYMYDRQFKMWNLHIIIMQFMSSSFVDLILLQFSYDFDPNLLLFAVQHALYFSPVW